MCVRVFFCRDGIILDAVDEDGRTPLLVAASRGYGTVLTTLKCKADMCKRDNSGKNAVLLAAESDEISILRVSVQHLFIRKVSFTWSVL